MILVLTYRKTKVPKYLMIFFFFVVSSIECTMNMEETGYSTTGRSYYFKDYDSVEALTKEVLTEDPSFYRISKAFGYRSKDDAAWHNFPNASAFTSTAYAGITDLFGKLGLEHSMNAYADHGATALVYSMFDIKYILSNKALAGDPLLKLYDQYEDEYIYKCLYTLPLGYMVRSDINDVWDSSLSNPFAVQNDFASETAGVSNIFSTINYTDNGEDGITITPEKTSHIYVYVGNKQVNTAVVKIDEEKESFKGINHGRIIDLGICEADVQISIKDEEGKLALNPMCYTINEENFIEWYNKLAANGYIIATKTDTKISGSITAAEDGIMLTSIPYDPSWSVYVDGNKVELVEIKEALIGVSLAAGTHTVVFKYMPRGLVLGGIISLVALVCLILICIIYRKNKDLIIPSYDEIDETNQKEITKEFEGFDSSKDNQAADTNINTQSEE